MWQLFIFFYFICDIAVVINLIKYYTNKQKNHKILRPAFYLSICNLILSAIWVLAATIFQIYWEQPAVTVASFFNLLFYFLYFLLLHVYTKQTHGIMIIFLLICYSVNFIIKILALLFLKPDYFRLLVSEKPKI